MRGFSISDICPELLIQSSSSREFFTDSPDSCASTSCSSPSDDDFTPKRRVIRRKPDLSFSAMIMMAIRESPHQMLTLSEIYKAISDKYPYFSTSDSRTWQNTIRHTLSTKSCFVRCRIAANEKSKGWHWMINEAGAQNSRIENGKVMTQVKNLAWLQSTLFDAYSHYPYYQK